MAVARFRPASRHLDAATRVAPSSRRARFALRASRRATCATLRVEACALRFAMCASASRENFSRVAHHDVMCITKTFRAHSCAENFLRARRHEINFVSTCCVCAKFFSRAHLRARNFFSRAHFIVAKTFSSRDVLREKFSRNVLREKFSRNMLCNIASRINSRHEVAQQVV
jgi:hypothetical protein